MGLRELGVVIALGGLAAACLGVPPGEAETRPDGGERHPRGASPDGASPDSAAVPACPDAFAVAYTSRLDVRPTGGALIGVLVIEALGDAVDVSNMQDGSDDSLQLELELSQPNYDPLAVGAVTGELDPAAAALIIGPLVAEENWTQPATPPPHKATARILIGNSLATLDFEITYVVGQDDVAVPRAGAMVYSACGE